MDESLPFFVEYTFKDDVKIKINTNELLRLKLSTLKDSSLFFMLLGIDKDTPFKEGISPEVFKNFEITSEHWYLVIKFIRKGMIFENNFEKINLLNDFNSIFLIPSLTKYINKYVERTNKLNEISYEKESSYNPMNPEEDYLKKYHWCRNFMYPRLKNDIDSMDLSWRLADRVDKYNKKSTQDNYYRKLIE
jgi:hypothetical protein